MLPRPASRRLQVALAALFLLAGALLVAPAAAAAAANAAEFRSVGEGGAVLYDSPSAQGRKLFVAKRYYPLAIVVTLEQWVKVRDASGDLAWVEKRALSDQRIVMVVAPRAAVQNAPDPAAPVVFDAEKDVALEVLAIVNPDWVRVRHLDGQSGYVRAAEVWGL
jgi:SH3-like domain-containing protein